MTHVICRLTAKSYDYLRNPTLGNRVWAAFTFCLHFYEDVKGGAKCRKCREFKWHSPGDVGDRTDAGVLMLFDNPWYNIKIAVQQTFSMSNQDIWYHNMIQPNSTFGWTQVWAGFTLIKGLLQLRFEHDTSTTRYNTLRGFSCARIRDRFHENQW